MPTAAIAYILSIIIVTALVCGLNPQMHKRVVILDSKYKVVDVAEPIVQPVKPVSQTPVQPTEVVKTVVQPTVTTTPVKTAQVPVKVQQTKPKTVSQPVKTTPVKNTQTKTTPVKQPVQTVKQPVKPVKKDVVKPAPVKTEPAKVVLTPQQESVLWNKWRSDLQNKIMNSVSLPPLPQGTVFKFSFTVDKNGRITNIKSWATDPKYNPYAIQYITPAIRNLQGKSILKFPNGTNRESTVFEGNIKISNVSKYSTAKDYNDVETIRH